MRAFVLMPFSKEYDDIYKLGIKETAKKLDVEAYRLDEELFDKGMLEKIYDEIQSCDFIIADLSNRNPNVFYELGYAHAIGKLCLLITQNTENIPFDLKHKRHIAYDSSITYLKEQLETNISWAKDEINRIRYTPFEIELTAIGDLKTTDEYAEAEIEFTLDIENKTNKTSAEIHSIYAHFGKEWTIKQDSKKLPYKKSDLKPFNYRYQIHPPMDKIPKKGWCQIKLNANRMIANVWEGDVIKDSYTIKGNILIEIVTETGTYTQTFPLSTSIDVLPF